MKYSELKTPKAGIDYIKLIIERGIKEYERRLFIGEDSIKDNEIRLILLRATLDNINIAVLNDKDL